MSDLSQADYQALAEFRYQIRRFLHFSEQIARSAGIEPQQHQLLLALKGWPEDHKATISELAERLQIRHHSAVELVNRAVERDLIRRERNAEDRREVLLALTPHGEELLLELSQAHRSELRSTAPALKEALNRLLAEAAHPPHLQEVDQ